eukprot:symbB.v1.2.022904.t1/scaffold2053.1/size90990/4
MEVSRGRFGAAFRNSDLGAQVLSVIEVDSGHPNAGADGHQMQSADVCDAWEEVQGLVKEKYLRLAREEELADTEERMKYQGLWAHYWCQRPFTSLLQHYLSTGNATLHLTRRVDHVATEVDSVTLRCDEMRCKAPLVILAVPSAEVLRVVPTLPVEVKEALQQIRYDQRMAVAVSLDHTVFPIVHEAFKDFLEVSLDVDDPNSSVHLVKRGPISYGDPIEVVVHSTCEVQWEDPIDAALNGISRVIGLPKAQLEGLLIDSKIIDWKDS